MASFDDAFHNPLQDGSERPCDFAEKSHDLPGCVNPSQDLVVIAVLSESKKPFRVFCESDENPVRNDSKNYQFCRCLDNNDWHMLIWRQARNVSGVWNKLASQRPAFIEAGGLLRFALILKLEPLLTGTAASVSSTFAALIRAEVK